MKIIKLFFLALMTSSFIIQASQLRKLLTFGSSILSASPLFLHSYLWSQERDNRDALISKLNDTDPVVQKFTREHLKKHGYKNFETLPIKTYDAACNDHFSMESRLDNCLAFSTDYEAEIKEALSASSKLSEDEKQRVLGNFRSNLDHEMLHMQDQHAKQSIAMQRYIPVLTEIAFLPLTIRLLKSKNIFTFLAGLTASIPLKWIIYKQALNAHRRHQEDNADRLMLHKNDNIDDLKAVMRFRTSIIRNAFASLYLEYLENGHSNSLVFDVIMKLFAHSPTDNDFDSQRYDKDPEYASQVNDKMIGLYERLEQQPFKWPFRLLQQSFDPTHPFILDGIKKISDRIEELENPKS